MFDESVELYQNIVIIKVSCPTIQHTYAVNLPVSFMQQTGLLDEFGSPVHFASHAPGIIWQLLVFTYH
jgi:hypothetical protein